MRNTLDAAVKLNPVPPALIDNKNTVAGPVSLKSSNAFMRASMFILPSRRRKRNPCLSRYSATIFRYDVNWDTTTLLIEGSLSRMASNALIKALI